VTSDRYCIQGAVWLDGKEQVTVTILESDLAAVEKERDDLRGALDIEVYHGMAYKARAETAEASLASIREGAREKALAILEENDITWPLLATQIVSAIFGGEA
jgi:hypothetical protein